jgi:hypothetical protein
MKKHFLIPDYLIGIEKGDRLRGGGGTFRSYHSNPSDASAHFITMHSPYVHLYTVLVQNIQVLYVQCAFRPPNDNSPCINHNVYCIKVFICLTLQQLSNYVENKKILSRANNFVMLLSK